MSGTLKPVNSLVRTVLGLFKLRIGFMIMLTALVGLAVAPGPALGALQVLVLALTVLVASASAGAFNQYYEHDSDHLMARTRGRAFVTGALPHTPAWLVLMAALLIGAVGAAAWFLNAVSATFVFLGAFFYAVVYTVWLKRRSWLNIVVGGMAGSFAVLAGAAAVDPVPGALAWLLAAVLFLWTPPHFWSLAIANQAEYEAAGVPMLPVVVGCLGLHASFSGARLHSQRRLCCQSFSELARSIWPARSRVAAISSTRPGAWPARLRARPPWAPFLPLWFN